MSRMDLTACYPGTQDLGSPEVARVHGDWERDSFSLGDPDAVAGVVLLLTPARGMRVPAEVQPV